MRNQYHWFCTGLCCFLVLRVPILAEGEEPVAQQLTCTRFSPARCLVEAQLRHKPLHLPACQGCSFDVLAWLHKCPFWTSGAFVEEPAGSEDCTPFMATNMQRMDLPDCYTGRCCWPMPHNITNFFQTQKARPHVWDYQPTTLECAVWQFNRAEVLQHLTANSTRVLILGGTASRQLFTRLVQMMRGQLKVVDFNMPLHASYAICEEADVMHLDSSLPIGTEVGEDAAGTLGELPLLGAGAGPLLADVCQSQPLQVDLLHAPSLQLQLEHLQQFMLRKPADEQLLVVASIDLSQPLTREYLSYMESIQEQTLKLVLIAPPLQNSLSGAQAALADAQRELLVRWISRVSPYWFYPVAFLDLDAITKTSRQPPGGLTAKHSHQCQLVWAAGKDAADCEHEFPQERVSGHAMIGIDLRADHQCFDEVHRNVWQIIFNMAIRGGVHLATAANAE